MALPAKIQDTFTPHEIFFLAEDELITILPRQSMDKLDLIGCSISNLTVMRRADVPLWLAIVLRKQSRCNIVAPEWLTETHLREIYDKEISQEGFAKLPWHWLEIALSLLDNAADDVNDPAQIRNLVQDIREVRQAKTRAGLTLVNEWHIQMDNLGIMEMNTVRPFMLMTMDKLRRIRGLVAETGDGEPAAEIIDDLEEPDEL